MPPTHRTPTKPTKTLIKPPATRSYPGIVANSPSFSILSNRLRVLHKESTHLFRRAHNTFTNDAHTVKLLDESDKKAEELMRLTEEMEAKIAELLAKGKKKVDGVAKEEDILRKVEEERVWKEEWMTWAKDDWYKQFGVGPAD